MPTEQEALNDLKAAIQNNFEREATKAESRKDVLRSLQHCLYSLKVNKPNDRSEIDRRYAVVITDMEKVMSYFKTYIVEEYMLSGTSQSNE